LSVTLKSGKDHFIEYKFPDQISLRIYYNKVYNSNRSIYYGRSVSHNLDPDISVELFKDEKLFGMIHFDAKYKVDENGSYKMDDLNKMHTYKDGIIGTLGAYIIGPINSYEIFHQEEFGFTVKDKISFPSVGAIPFNVTTTDRLQETQYIIDIIEEFIKLGKTENAIFAKEEHTPYLAVQRLVGNIARGEKNEL
jgi:predicted component of viral defense system (DUF524 family)